jgi:hypothetical protein
MSEHPFKTRGRRVYVRRSVRERFEEKVRKATPDGCWIWQGSIIPICGYGCLRVCLPDGRRVTQYAHRIAWELENGQIGDGLFVLHHCDVRACVNPAHLFLGTARDNTQDMIAKGRGSSQLRPDRLIRGSAHPNAKVTESAVRDIRARAKAGGESFNAIGRSHGITGEMVGLIVKRRWWRHVED